MTGREHATPPAVTADQKSVMDAFKKGVAVSTWQCAPDDGLSNWSQWAKSRWPFQFFGIGRVKDSIDDTPDFWNRYRTHSGLKWGACMYMTLRMQPKRFFLDPIGLPRYKEDIENAKKLGCNSFRLSLGRSLASKMQLEQADKRL